MNRVRTPATECVVAEFAIGEEAVDDGLGVVTITVEGTDFTVFVTGGVLPDGETSKTFNNATMAFRYAMEVVEELVDQEAEDYDE